MEKRQLTPQFVARSLGLSDPTEDLAPFSTWCTDSRKVIPGSLFIAIPGETFDGHHFIDSAIQAGARGILCRSNTPIKKGAHFFRVPDSLQGIRTLAIHWRRQFDIPVAVVAGSVGKTTTKEFLSALFRGKWGRVLNTQGSQNGFLGIAITLLDLQPGHEAAVIEVGIDEPGAMEMHLKIVQPGSAVLTAIGPEHLEKLIDISTVAREECLALTSVAERQGTVAVNLDDPWISPLASQLNTGRVFGFSMKEAPRIQGIRGMLSTHGEALEVSGLGLEGSLRLPLPGAHNAQNLLAALTLARGHGLSWEEIQAGLQTFIPPPGRSEVRIIPGPEGSTLSVVCDYYNAQPSSMEAGLRLLNQISRGKNSQRWACLGDMLEMGKDEENLHRVLAQAISELEIENILLFGPRMKFLFEELRFSKLPKPFHGKVAHFSSHAELVDYLLGSLGPKDFLLIKGSHGMKMEEVWKLLEEHSRKSWTSSLKG